MNIPRNASFTNFINDSHEPSTHVLRDWLNFHIMFLEFKCCVMFLLSCSLTNVLSSDLPPTTLLPLSYIMIFTCHFLAINRLRANINDSVVTLSANCRCNALIFKETKIIRYCLVNAGFFLAYFVALTFIGPK